MYKLIRFLLWCVILLGALVGLARAFALRWWRVPDQDPFLEASVAPTLRGGDLIILWRLTRPRRGDLVLCPEPNAQGRAVVGRLVGDPGDTVVVKGSEVSVNDHKAYTERACLASEFLVRDPNVGANVKQSCQVEVLNGHVHMRGSVGGYKMVPPDAKKEVEDGRAFLLSDNRLFPYDSRDYGTVERGSCAEAVVFRLSGGKGFFDQSSRFTFIQ